jgi:hypothetical protein
MNENVAAHYTQCQLLERILSGLEAIGKTPKTVTVDERPPWMNFISAVARHRMILSGSWD